jgi:NADH:ubiquinone oxidoreductase subunit 3 (subunit A)
VATVLLLAAYVVSVATSQLKVGGAVSAVCLVAIASAGLLYAWRLGAGGLVE